LPNASRSEEAQYYEHSRLLPGYPHLEMRTAWVPQQTGQPQKGTVNFSAGISDSILPRARKHRVLLGRKQGKGFQLSLLRVGGFRPPYQEGRALAKGVSGSASASGVFWIQLTGWLYSPQQVHQSTLPGNGRLHPVSKLHSIFIFL
jgi:hypothetical protein